MKYDVIFSADDYGPIPAINNGIIEAVNADCINSVEVFVNHNNFKESIDNLLHTCQDKTFELGCHLTITSGKPITGLKSLFVRNNLIFRNKNGYFREYTDLRRTIGKNNRKEQVKRLKDELHAQIDQFEKDGLKDKLTHLSCHHNALFFFDDYLDAYFEVAKDHDLAVRTPHGRPFSRHKNYVKYVELMSRTNLSAADRLKLITFAKSIPKLVDKTNNPPPPQRPVYHINTNYGPVSILKLDEDDIEEKAEDKNHDLVKELKKYKDMGIIEYVFHLITDDYNKLEVFKKQTEFSSCNYTGIDNAYFDSRMAEMRSLIKYKNVINAMINKESWNKL